ncbi:MAG: DUF2206 domain-containing protein [Candidatus Bathyarchaeia archaeon]
MQNKTKLKTFLTLIALQLTANALILLNIPIVRQTFIFAYFTLMPGLLIIQLLKPKDLRKTEILTFSVGISVALLMFIGLFVNELGFSIGITRPLSLVPLLTALNIFILASTILVISKGDYTILQKIKINEKPHTIHLLILLIITTSILGAIWVTIYRNNTILMLTIALIAITFSIGLFSNKVFPPKSYKIAILGIALAILLHATLIYKYPIPYGSDTSYELYIYESTENKAYWNSTLFRDQLHGRLNSMASITVLPTIYSTILNLDPLYVRKILYAVIFSFVPLILFQFWQKNFGYKRSFIAVFFFMSSITFFTEMVGLGRQMIAELFFALLLIIIFNRKRTFFDNACYAIFSVALVISHYALAEIFLGLIILTTLIVLILTRKPTRKATITMTAFFLVVMFTWYIYTSHSTVFESTVSFGNYVLEQLDEFFNLSSREPTILRALGLEKPETIWNLASRVFFYLTELLIALGFIALITKRTDIKLENEQFIFTIVAMFFLGLTIVMPGMSKTLNATRFYHILLFILAPLCVLGSEFLTKLIFKQRHNLASTSLLFMVLVPYFLFQSGFIYELVNNESYAPLSLHRMDPYRLYFWAGFADDPSVHGVKWLSANVNFKQTHIFADLSSIRHLLRAYGLIPDRYVTSVSNTTIMSQGQLVYLNSLNTVHNVTVTGSMAIGRVYTPPTNEISFLENMNKIYTNGGAEILQNQP